MQIIGLRLPFQILQQIYFLLNNSIELSMQDSI